MLEYARKSGSTGKFYHNLDELGSNAILVLPPSGHFWKYHEQPAISGWSSKVAGYPGDSPSGLLYKIGRLDRRVACSFLH